MNQKRSYSHKVNSFVVTMLIAALVLANVGFIVTFGRAALELVFVLRDYVIALTEAVEAGTPEPPEAVKWKKGAWLNPDFRLDIAPASAGTAEDDQGLWP